MRFGRIGKGALFALIVLCFQTPSPAQTVAKKPLTHDVYDGWKSARAGAFTENGAWIHYSIVPQEGDGELFVMSTSGGEPIRIPRGTAARFTRDGKFLVCTVAPPKADVDKARREKKPTKDQPKNDLLILSLADGKQTIIARVKSWNLAPKGSDWIAYQLEEPPTPPADKKPEEPKPPASPSDDASDLVALAEQAAQGAQPPKPGQESKESKPQKKKDHAAGSEWILRRLSTGEETKLADVASLTFNEEGTLLAIAVSTKDGAGDGLFLRDLGSGANTPLMTGLGRYTQVAFDKSSKKIAFITDRDDYKADPPSCGLYLTTIGAKEPRRVAAEGVEGLPKGWWVSNRGSVRFSESGARLVFPIAPKPEPEKKDETPEEDKVQVDVWHYRDAPLMPVQLLQAGATRNRTFDAVAFLDSGRLLPLEDESLLNVTVGNKGDADVAIANVSEPYGVEASWNPGINDVYLINLRSGKRERILERFNGAATLSPHGKFAVWFDGERKAWFARDVATGKVVNLTQDVPYPVHDVDDDHPDLPGPQGSGGWVEGDAGVLVYDEFDVWLCDPSGSKKPVCVTDGFGRTWGLRLRVTPTDREKDAFEPEAQLLLSAFDVRTKASGYYRDFLGAKDRPTKLIFGDKAYAFLMKAESADRVLMTRQSFDEYPDLWLTNLSFESPRKITDANPQMKEYIWGKSELVSWTSLDGVPLQGILVKPEDFDPGKKYPMIVYFYERESDNLHRHRVPAPSASTINPTVFASNGYLVFMPDIPYKIGYPGESAVNAILPGVTALVSRGYVDAKRMGIQGQSWGGYQVAYLITRTNMFAAAGAGAAVTNMFSAYGGIRWGSGLVRQMQYERGQSRIGGTPWDATLRYIENSPIFWADKVQTPVLLMNNDKDGAVPWYQGIEFFTALRRLDKPCWMLVYNNEDHNLTQRKNQKDLAVRLQQFFDHYLKGAAAPVWMTEGIPAVKKGKTLGLEIRERSPSASGASGG